MARLRVKRPRRRPLSDHTYAVLRAVQNATLGVRSAVTLEAALEHTPTAQDWRSAALLAERGLISAHAGEVRIRPDGARVLGRIP
jgi:hypothetical protein